MRKLPYSFICFNLFYTVISVASSEKITYGLENALKIPKIQTQQSIYYIQTGSFKNKTRADHQKKELEKLISYPVNITHKIPFYAVLIGPIPTIKEQQAIAHDILNKKQHIYPISKKLPSKTSPKKHFNTPPPHTRLLPTLTSQTFTSHWFTTLGGSVQYPSLNRSAYVSNGSDFPAPYNQDHYTAKNESSSEVLTFMIGREWQQNTTWVPSYQIGLSYQHLFTAQVNGNILQYNQPEFNNYDYAWHISSDLILATSKLNLYTLGQFSPFLTGGIGVALNHGTGYIETAHSEITARVSPSYADNTHRQLAYAVGAGLDFKLSPTFILSLSWLYEDLGSMQSGQGFETWHDTYLNLGRWRTNQAMLSFTYLFNQ